jgi:hypothetical protein
MRNDMVILRLHCADGSVFINIGKGIASFFGVPEPKKGAISVMASGFLMFAHRYNPDGTSDSICSKCFQTIATVRDKAELAEIEGQHLCEPHLLERFQRVSFERRNDVTNRVGLRYFLHRV